MLSEFVAITFHKEDAHPAGRKLKEQKNFCLDGCQERFQVLFPHWVDHTNHFHLWKCKWYYVPRLDEGNDVSTINEGLSLSNKVIF